MRDKDCENGGSNFTGLFGVKMEHIRGDFKYLDRDHDKTI
jgi:hypothetical protein